MDNKNRTLPKIEDECQLAKRTTEKLLKSLNNEIFNAFMEQSKHDDYFDMRKADEKND